MASFSSRTWARLRYSRGYGHVRMPGVLVQNSRYTDDTQSVGSFVFPIAIYRALRCDRCLVIPTCSSVSAPFHGDGFGEKDQFLWRTISVSCTSCVGRAGRSQRAWMSWSTKGTRLRPTSCQAWSTPTSRTRRGVDTLEILHDDGSRTNVWPNRSECGFSRARWNWYSSSLADRTNRATNPPR